MSRCGSTAITVRLGGLRGALGGLKKLKKVCPDFVKKARFLGLTAVSMNGWRSVSSCLPISLQQSVVRIRQKVASVRSFSAICPDLVMTAALSSFRKVDLRSKSEQL